MFYAAPSPVKKLKLNQFLKVEAPPDDYIAKLFAQLKHFTDILANHDFDFKPSEANEVIERLHFLLNRETTDDLIANSLKMLLDFEEPLPEELTQIATMPLLTEGQINIFSPLNWPIDYPPLFTRDVNSFSKPLMDQEQIKEIMRGIETFTGEKVQLSAKIASELVNDMSTATLYPIPIQDDILANDLAQMVTFMANRITRLIQSSKT